MFSIATAHKCADTGHRAGLVTLGNVIQATLSSEYGHLRLLPPSLKSKTKLVISDRYGTVVLNVDLLDWFCFRSKTRLNNLSILVSASSHH